PLDSSECPECQTKFSGVSEEALGECGACNQLVPLESTRCPECGVVFVADDVVDILRTWVHETGINIRKLFDKFDENGDGTIDSDELKTGLLGLNLADLPPSQVERLVAEIDADGNGVIDLDEFEAILMGEVEDHAGVEETSETEEVAEEELASDGEVEAVDDDAVTEDDDELDEDLENEAEAEMDEDLDEEIEEEDFELEDDEEADVSVDDTEEDDTPIHPLQALSDMMDEHEISAQRMFNDLDVDGNGLISLAELNAALTEKYGDVIDLDNLESIIDGVDTDGDGMIDITEFIESMESLDDHEEVIEEEAEPKEFPSPWQKRMMSKTWNDNVWPILHVGFGILIALILVNGLIGPVDGSGGTVAYQANDVLPPVSMNLNETDLYPCDEKYQLNGCKNSLTPLAGENGASSMPKGFYWDAYLFLFLFGAGLCASLYLHLVQAPAWRARAKAMKEIADDKADAVEASEGDNEADSDEGEDDDSDAVSDDVDDESAEEFQEEEDEVDSSEEDEDAGGADDEEGDDSIDIGSHIGLVLEDEEVFGTILEFDDDEGTVTIEEDGSGDLITGYQEDMFIE
ncbi:MAG: EF-hand domain-containing protein, partial [Poseidonia sp.]